MKSKPKFFLPGDKVRIRGEKGIFTIAAEGYFTSQVDYESEFNEDDYKLFNYATTESAWHEYRNITFVKAGWMRKLL